MRLRAAALLAVPALLLAACSAEASPEPDEVLPGAAEAMAAVETVRFTLEVDGSVEGLDVQGAEGVVTASGEAEGKGTVTAMGMKVEIDYIIIGEDAWVKGFTGGYQQLPVGDDLLPYDPRIIIDPADGIAPVLASWTEAEPQDAEKLDGVDTYKYVVTFDPVVFGRFIPAAGDWNTATVWFDADTLRVVQAEFAQDDATITFRLSDYDEPVTIEAP
jgi:lipoprotein LprG